MTVREFPSQFTRVMFGVAFRHGSLSNEEGGGLLDDGVIRIDNAYYNNFPDQVTKRKS